MTLVKFPDVMEFRLDNLEVDPMGVTDLGADVSLKFYLPSGYSSFEENRLWYDMEQWKATLDQISSGFFDGTEICDLSKKIIISFSVSGLVAKMKISVNRPIPIRGFARAEYETKTEIENLHRFSVFMSSVLDEYNLIV